MIKTGLNQIETLGFDFVFSKLLSTPFSVCKGKTVEVKAYATPDQLKELNAGYRFGLALAEHIKTGKNGFDGIDIDGFRPNTFRGLGSHDYAESEGKLYFVALSDNEIMNAGQKMIQGERFFVGPAASRWRTLLNQNFTGYRMRTNPEGFAFLEKSIDTSAMIKKAVADLKENGFAKVALPMKSAANVRQQLWLNGYRSLSIKEDGAGILVKIRTTLDDEIEDARIHLRKNETYKIKGDFSPTYIYNRLRQLNSDLDVKREKDGLFIFYRTKTESNIDSISSRIESFIHSDDTEMKLALESVAEATRIRPIISNNFRGLFRTKVVYDANGNAFLKIWKNQ